MLLWFFYILFYVFHFTRSYMFFVFTVSVLDAKTAKSAMFMAMGQVGEAEDVVDMKDSPSTIQGDGATGTWTAGGEHGLYLDCYCKVAPQTASSNYTVLQRARLTISSDGLVVKAELLGERTRIQAKNA